MAFQFVEVVFAVGAITIQLRHRQNGSIAIGDEHGVFIHFARRQHLHSLERNGFAAHVRDVQLVDQLRCAVDVDDDRRLEHAHLDRLIDALAHRRLGGAVPEIRRCGECNE